MARTSKNKRRSDPAQVRAAVKKGLGRALKVLGVCLAVAAVVVLTAFGTRGARHWLQTSPTFAVENIHVSGLKNASQADVLARCGIRKGDNIFDVDVDDVARALGEHPWIRDVEVRRRLPRSVFISVTEHVPAALADMGGLYYVDDEGKAFKRVSAGDRVDLPILRGISREVYSREPEESEELLREGIAVAALYTASGLETKMPLSDIETDAIEGLTLRCGEGATVVHLGRGSYQQKLRRLDRVFAELQERKVSALVIRLDNRARPGWVAVSLDRPETGSFN